MGGSESKLVCRISPQRIGVVVYVGNSIRRGNPEVLFEPLPISSGVWLIVVVLRFATDQHHDRQGAEHGNEIFQR